MFVDWLKILTNEKQAVQFRSPILLVCEQKRCSHMPGSNDADDAGQWAVSKNIDLAAEYLQRDLDKLARWCAKWRIKLNPEKQKS